MNINLNTLRDEKSNIVRQSYGPDGNELAEKIIEYLNKDFPTMQLQYTPASGVFTIKGSKNASIIPTQLERIVMHIWRIQMLPKSDPQQDYQFKFFTLNTGQFSDFQREGPSGHLSNKALKQKKHFYR